MILRKLFAILALMAIIGQEKTPEEDVAKAYEYADLILKERERNF